VSIRRNLCVDVAERSDDFVEAVRLYRRDKGRYNPSPVHDRVDLAPGAKVARLKGRIRHISVRSLGHQLEKLNSYTDAQVRDLEARGVKVTTLRVFLEFPGAFLKAYFGRRHCLRGIYGFMTAMKEACSAPVQVAMTLTEPAFCVELVPHATAVNTATNDRIRLRFNHNLCILKSPSNAEPTAPLPRYDTFYVPPLTCVIRELVGDLRAAVAHLLAQSTRGGRSDHQVRHERRGRLD